MDAEDQDVNSIRSRHIYYEDKTYGFTSEYQLYGDTDFTGSNKKDAFILTTDEEYGASSQDYIEDNLG